MTVEGEVQARGATTSGGGFVKVVGVLTAVNVLTAAAGFITGPLQARALGPAGRGDLAAILVVLAFATPLLSLSVGAYAAREVAAGEDAGRIGWSLGAFAFVIGVIAALLAFPAASWLAGDREVVEGWLRVVFLLLPLSLPAAVLYSMLSGLERWRTVVALRVLPVALAVTCIPLLYVTDRLTVDAAVAVAVVGSVAGAIPVFGILWRKPVQISLAVVRAGVAFGARAWAGYVTNVANARLDQLLMIRFVSAAELGLYAIAVTLASLPSMLTGALGPPLLNRIVRGDRDVVAQSLRVTLAAVTVAVSGLAIATPWLLPLLFGTAFDDAVDMTIVLLVAAVPLAGVAVLSTALIANSQPAVPSIGEAAALVVTAAGLIVLLKPLGGLGAALTSLAAYGVNFVVQLAAVRRSFGGSMGGYLFPRREDAVVLRRILRRSRAGAA